MNGNVQQICNPDHIRSLRKLSSAACAPTQLTFDC